MNKLQSLTKEEYKIVLNYLLLANECNEELTEIEKELAKLFGIDEESKDYDYLIDMVYNGDPIKTFLKNVNIKYIEKGEFENEN